jgi:hypothetical protein
MRRLAFVALACATLAACQQEPNVSLPTHPGRDSNVVVRRIEQRVSAEVSPRWAGPMVTIASIESGFRCDVGLFQVRAHPTRDCEGGISAGIVYLDHCIAQGASSDADLYRCWNSGGIHTPTSRLDAPYRRLLSGHSGG